MNSLDWICLAVILLSVVWAAIQGIFMELFHLGGVLVGYLFAVWEGWRLAPYFEPHVKSYTLAKACGGIVIFMSVMIIAGIAGRITRWAMKEVGLRWFDRLLGGVFGFVRGAALCTIGVMTLAAVAPHSLWIAESRTGAYFVLTARMAAALAPEGLRDELRDGLERVRKQQQELLHPSKSDTTNGGSAATGDGKTSGETSKQGKPSEKRKQDVQSKPVVKT